MFVNRAWLLPVQALVRLQVVKNGRVRKGLTARRLACVIAPDPPVSSRQRPAPEATPIPAPPTQMLIRQPRFGKLWREPRSGKLWRLRLRFI